MKTTDQMIVRYVSLTIQQWTLSKGQKIPKHQIPKGVEEGRVLIKEYKNMQVYNANKRIDVNGPPLRFSFFASSSVKCFPSFRTTTMGFSSASSSSSDPLPSFSGRSGIGGRRSRPNSSIPSKYCGSSSSSIVALPAIWFWSFTRKEGVWLL